MMEVPHKQEPRIVAVAGPLAIRQVPASPRNYTLHRSTATINILVLHCTDGCEGTSKDTDVARMFQNPSLVPRRSCHYVVDTDSITQCVPDTANAWHCGKFGNARGLGIELCGRAAQTREQWLDELSLPMLCIAARWAADKCLQYKLPAQFVDAEGLRRNHAGITTHAEVGAAWKQTTHTDPGKGFPLDLFIQAVQTALTSKK